MKNIKYFFIGVLTISLFTLQCYAQDMQDVESVKKQIEKEQTSFMENFNNGDAKASAEYYTMDAIVMPPNTPEVKGKDAIEKLWQSFIDLGKAKVMLSTGNIAVSGNLAVVYQTYLFEATAESGQAIKDNGKSVVVYEKQEDGSWLIIYDIWNSNQPLPTNN